MADDKIELRSEKVRRIIDERPSWIVRYGITVITVVTLGLLAGAYLISCPETVRVVRHIFAVQVSHQHLAII